MINTNNGGLGIGDWGLGNNDHFTTVLFSVSYKTLIGGKSE